MAYAAVISLKHTIFNPTNNIQIPRSSRKKLVYLCSTLKKLDDNRDVNIDRSKLNEVEAEIRDAAYKLEDAIQTYALYRSLDLPIPPVEGDDLKREIDLFFERVNKLREEYIRVLDHPLPVQDVSSTHDFGGNRPKTVGLSDQIDMILNELIDFQSGAEILSLVGMAGIGKTRLAREIYQHPLILQHFDFVAWASVGQKPNKEDVFADVVAQIEGRPRDLYVGKGIDHLSEISCEILRGGRYLIVLDDVWSTEVCDLLCSWLPDVENGSRFLLTTRLEELIEFYSDGFYQIPFLDKEESWNLLRQNVFDENYFPRQLEKVGRKIAEKCEGLPLLILTVARILRGLDKNEELWKKVAEDKTSVFTDAYEEIIEVLYSSYEYLPQKLKACFLYMGVFPQTSHITLPKLLHLWLVENFFYHKLFEYDSKYMRTSFAMECLKRLVSNSVVIVCKHGSDFRIKSCKLHSAYWYLCTKEARKDKLFHVLKRLNDGSKDHIEGCRRLSVQNNTLFGIKEVHNSMAETYTARSLLCTGPYHEYQVPLCLNLVLLKVLDAAAIRFYEFPIEVVKLVRLKYLSLTHPGELPCSISNLQQLQFLIVHHHHNIRFIRDPTSSRLPKEMRDEIRDMREVWSTELREDSTCLVKEIWEMICDIQQVWIIAVIRYPIFLTKNIWMDMWKLNFGIQENVDDSDESLSMKSCIEEEGDESEGRCDIKDNGEDSEGRGDIEEDGEDSEEIFSMLFRIEDGEESEETCAIQEDGEDSEERCHIQEEGEESEESSSMISSDGVDSEEIYNTLKDIGHSVSSRSMMLADARKNLAEALADRTWRNYTPTSLWNIRKNVSDLQQLWSTKSLRDSICYPEIWVQILEKTWDMQEMWSTKLQRDSMSLVKEIWEEMWDMQEVKRTELLRDSISLPREIWEMRELWYLRIIGRNLPDPSYGQRLPNLSTLHVNSHSCTYSVFNSLPRLRKLGIKIELRPDVPETWNFFKHLRLLKELRSLKCVVVNPQLRSAPPHRLSYLPSSLKKLSLNGLGYGWECMSVIGSLPKLQVLKLRCSAFQGPKWETKAKEFPRLKYLLLEGIDLVKWKMELVGCFPSLECLIIQHCYKLKKLPGIVIKSLKKIEVVDCTPSVMAYAHRYTAHPWVEEVEITSSWKLRR